MASEWTSSLDLHLEIRRGRGRRTGLEEALRDAIRAGRLAPGERLPSSRALAADLGLSRGTVSGAYDQLGAEGYLEPRQGSGTRVARLPGAPSAPPVRESPGPPGRAPVRTLSLEPGRPDVTTFPVPAWTRAVRDGLGRAAADSLGFGDPRGRAELRTALAAYLRRTRGVLADPRHIVVTTGYAQGLAVLGRALLEHGPGAVAMEDPGLGFHREIVRRAGLAPRALPVDRDGARVDALTRDGSEAVRAAVVTPAHQYPTGAVLSPGRRHALVAWSRDSGGLVVEDDYDGEFRYDRRPVGAVQGMAPDAVAHLGSTSKSLGPAVRLGWVVVPEQWVDAVVEAKRHMDHRTDTVSQLALAEMIRSHAYDRHVRGARLRYRRRRDHLVRRLEPLVESGAVAVTGVSAGLHALVRLGRGLAEEAVLQAGERHGVRLTGLGEHRHDPLAPGDGTRGVVVGFGAPTEAAYPRAVEALVRALGG